MQSLVRLHYLDPATVKTTAKADALCRQGRLGKTFLVPLEYGGSDAATNILYGPPDIAPRKADCDRALTTPLAPEEEVIQYTAKPQYRGDSLIPKTLKLQVRTSQTSNQQTLTVWAVSTRIPSTYRATPLLRSISATIATITAAYAIDHFGISAILPGAIALAAAYVTLVGIFPAGKPTADSSPLTANPEPEIAPPTPTAPIERQYQWAEACQQAWDAHDRNTMLPACTKAAEEGHPHSQYLLGNMYMYGLAGTERDAARGADLWHQAALAGVDIAQFNVGRLYQEGLTVKRDLATAFDWYEKAAAQGNTLAIHNIGHFYQEGIVVRADIKEAASWYEKSAGSGQPESQYSLAILYFEGKGIPQDKIRAYAWLSLARDAKHPPAEGSFASLAEQLTDAEKEAGNQLARALLQP